MLKPPTKVPYLLGFGRDYFWLAVRLWVSQYQSSVLQFNLPLLRILVLCIISSRTLLNLMKAYWGQSPAGRLGSDLVPTLSSRLFVESLHRFQTTVTRRIIWLQSLTVTVITQHRQSVSTRNERSSFFQLCETPFSWGIQQGGENLYDSVNTAKYTVDLLGNVRQCLCGS